MGSKRKEQPIEKQLALARCKILVGACAFVDDHSIGSYKSLRRAVNEYRKLVKLDEKGRAIQ